MAEPISIQQLKDASLDVKSLEEVVNGDENVVVTTRLGETYPSVKGSIKKVFENGGLPATPFATKALMTASALVDGDYAMVTDDATNNGLYVKTAGTWVKSAYDPLAQAKLDATTKSDAAKSEAIASSNTHTDEVETQLTTYINLKTENTYTDSNARIFTWADDNEDILAYIDANAKLHLSGMAESVQDAIGNAGNAPANIDLMRKFKISDAFEPQALNLLMFAQTQDYGYRVPAPLGIYKQRFSIGTGWVDSFTLAVDPPVTPVDTPYGVNRGVVHPHILEFPNGFNGWRYIIVMTGYTAGKTIEENPFLYGSNDLVSFELLTGLLDEPDSHTTEYGFKYNSDAVLSHDPITNELLVIWRRYEPITNPDAPPSEKTVARHYMRRTRDLINFTEKEVIWETGDTTGRGDLLSPAYIYDASNGVWHMFACANGSADAGISHFTNTEITQGWQFKNYVAMNTGSKPWHMDARWVGDKIVLLIQERDVNQGALRFGVQDTVDDFTNFTWANAFFNTSGDSVYKGTFVPEFNKAGQMRLHVLWTYGPGSSNPYKLLKHTTNYFDAGRNE